MKYVVHGSYNVGSVDGRLLPLMMLVKTEKFFGGGQTEMYVVAWEWPILP